MDYKESLLRRKWKFQNKFKMLVSGMGSLGAMTILDFTKEGVLMVDDGKTEFKYESRDGILEISSIANSRNSLRLRICELTSNKLIVALSGRKGLEGHDKFGPEIVELEYAPADT